MSSFIKVAECLYRYSPNDFYYARHKRNGKQIWESLKTTDKEHAKRLLRDKKMQLEKVDASAGKLNLDALCLRYLGTIQHQKPKTIEAKTGGDEWPEGVTQQVKAIKPSQVQTFLSVQGKRVGKSAYNQYVQVIRDLFACAVAGRIIAVSPAAAIIQRKRDKPIRLTPSPEEFDEIVRSIRSQKFADTAEDSADFLEFIGLTGLPQAETSPIEWPDVNLKKNEITTFRYKTSQGFVIPIFPQLRPLMEKLHKERKHEGRIFKVANVKKSLESACIRLGFPKFTQSHFAACLLHKP